MANIAAQREKADEIFKKETEALTARKEDLDRQLEIMQTKFKERMTEFAERRKVLEEAQVQVQLQAQTHTQLQV
jgi:hypothetical protein